MPKWIAVVLNVGSCKAELPAVKAYDRRIGNKSSAVIEMGDHARAKWAEKLWGLPCPFRGGAGSPCNTAPPGPRTISVPSCILIRQTVWSQYTNVTDRQTGQRSRSIVRTVTSNGRRKSLVSIRVRARYMDKSNGDGVDTETPSHSA